MSQGVSIIIPVYNSRVSLECILPSILAQSGVDFEIIIVDDGSDKRTKDFLKNLNHPRVRVFLKKQNQGQASVRNLGVKKSKYNLVAFLDSDCLPEGNWVNVIDKIFKDSSIDFCFGKIIYYKNNYFGFYPEKIVENKTASWPMSGNMVFRKKVFNKIKGFDEKLLNNEDTDIALKAVKKGFNYKKSVSLIVYHLPAYWTVRELFKSAQNASTWILFKKRYPNYYKHFGGPVKFGFLISPQDYLILFLSPFLIPILFLRFLFHGKTEFKLFFAKWPVFFLLKRFYIYKTALKERKFLI